MANLLVPDLVAYQGTGTVYSGPTVGPLQNANLDSSWTGNGGTDDVFSVFDSITTTGHGSRLGSADVSRQEITFGNVATAESGAERPLTVSQIGSPNVLSSTAATRPAEPSTRPGSALASAIDQILGLALDADSHDTLIGDLAFEQLSWGTHRARGTATFGTTR